MRIGIESPGIVKQQVMKAAKDLIEYDNNDKVDLSPQKGEVNISLDATNKINSREIFLNLQDGYFGGVNGVIGANVKFDSATKEIHSAEIQTEKFFNTSYGKSLIDIETFRLEEKELKGKPVIVYEKDHSDAYLDESYRSTVTVDKNSGEIIKVKNWDERKDLALQLKRVVTSKSGLGLTALGGLLAAMPGVSWGLGSTYAAVAGPVGAVLTALGLAYLITKT